MHWTRNSAPSPCVGRNWATMNDGPLDLELELIESSLLPAERLRRDGDSCEISSEDSKLVICFQTTSRYPAKDAVELEIKGSEVGREEAEGWKKWVNERLREWDTTEEQVRASKHTLTPGIRCIRFSLPTSCLFLLRIPCQRPLRKRPLSTSRMKMPLHITSSSLRITLSPLRNGKISCLYLPSYLWSDSRKSDIQE
jgi:hypothetical protein